MGRFINADGYTSTGQGILGNNMFAYCGNNPIRNVDPSGYLCAKHAGAVGEYRPDYVIYYIHPESDENLDGPAKQNHSRSGCRYVPVSSFEELTNAINSTPNYVDDVFIYLHGDESNLVFYYAQYYSAESIEEYFKEITIYGDIYLFSCKGGRGKLASTMASNTKCPVIASVYKVSFGKGFARCGWTNYLLDLWDYGPYSWYCFYPNGSMEQVNYWGMTTQ